MRRSILPALALAATLVGMAGAARAQALGAGPAIRIEADQTPLAEVLRTLALQTGIDIVFAESTVRGRAVSGRYLGDDLEGALRTVLRDSGLRAERVRPRQYVIVPEVGLGSGPTRPAPRGTLEGLVVDAESGEPLPGAHVVLLGLGIGAATNTAGYFAIPGLPAGAYAVRVSFVGYRTAEVELPVYPAAQLDRPVIRLVPQPLAAEGVVVEGSAEERSDLEIVPGSARVGVHEAALLPSLLGAGDAFAALDWLPGVIRAGELGGELVVRGAEAQYNRYFLDGAPVIHPWHRFGMLSIFQPEALRSVRLHKGSYPAEFGGALSAVVDIEMRDGERGRAAGMVAVSPVSARGVVEAPLSERLSMMLTARHTLFDFLLAPRLRITTVDGLPSFTFRTPLSEAGHDGQEVGYHFFDAGAKLTWRLAEAQRLSLSVFEGGDRLDATAPRATLYPVRRGRDAADTSAVNLAKRWGNRVISARYRGLVSERVFLTATAYYSGYTTRDSRQHLPRRSADVDSDYGLRFAEVGARLDADFYHSLEHQIRAGIGIIGRDFASTLVERLDNLDGGVLRRHHIDRVRALEIVAYVQDTWQPAAGWQLQPGLRLEYFGLGGYLSLNPRFHLRHVLARDRVHLRAGLSRQTQPLHRIREGSIGSNGIASERWVPASERVRPASAWQLAVGLEWQPRHWLRFDAEVFARRLEDILLLPDPQTVRPGGVGFGPDLLEQLVPGMARGAGVELAARVERERWRGGLSYSFARAQERVPGSVFRAARYDAPHQLEAFVIGGRGPWTVALAGTLRSGYPLTITSADEAYAAPAATLHNGRLPLYARADLSVGYNFRLLGLDWVAQAQAYNVLNRRNTVGRHFFSEMAVVTGDEGVGFGLLPMLSLKARW